MIPLLKDRTIPYLILMLLITLAYANSLQNSFVSDDEYLIVNNPGLDFSTIREIPSIFTRPLQWNIPAGNAKQVYYRPALSALFVFNYKIWGLSPSGFHLTNIFLHLISAIVLYKIGLLLLNNDASVSLIGASIFAAHPVHNESVGRTACGEVIAGFFIILSVYFFLRERRYISFFTFFLALLSKESAAALPFALLIISAHKKGVKKGGLAIMPYMLLIGAYLIIRTMIVDIVFGDKIPQPMYTRLLTMAVATLDYIRLLLIPYSLSPFYPARWHTSIFESKVILAAVILSLLVFLAFRMRKDMAMLFLLAFPFIMLAPAIWMVNAYAAGNENVYIAERYLYAPAAAFSLFISAYSVKLFGDASRGYLKIGWTLVIMIFTLITVSSNAIWKNDITLYKKIIERSPNNAFAHYNLGVVYYRQGRPGEAIQEYAIALRFDPDDADIHHNLGLAYHSQGRVDEAISEYQAALRLKPDSPDTYTNLGNVYAEQHRWDDAAQMYQNALKLMPDLAETHYNLGIVYYKKGMPDKAIEEYRTALRLNPTMQMPAINLELPAQQRN